MSCGSGNHRIPRSILQLTNTSSIPSQLVGQQNQTRRNFESSSCLSLLVCHFCRPLSGFWIAYFGLCQAFENPSPPLEPLSFPSTYIYKKFQRTAIYSFFLTMMSIFKACLTSEVSWFCSPCRESIDVGEKRKKKQQPITAFSIRWLASENSRKPKN